MHGREKPSKMKTNCPQLRIARPTSSFDAIRKFYQTGFGLDFLGEFKDHEGFDGIMLGHSEWPYHFEFTLHRNSPVKPTPTQEDLIVFYIPNKGDWKRTIDKLEVAGFSSIQSFNPYWDKFGKTFEDPDGYRIVIQNAEWA